MIDFEQRAIKQRLASQTYSSLPLKDFIKSVLVECGYDLGRMDNVYVDEYVTGFPNIWGCMKKDGKLITYFTNDRAEKFEKNYDDPYEFICAFLINSISRHKG